MTIVNNSDIFAQFFRVNFFILENVIPQMPLSVIYQTRASFFWSTRYRQQKICCSEAGYLTPERDNSYIRYFRLTSLVRFAGFFREKRKKDGEQTEKQNFFALAELLRSRNEVFMANQRLANRRKT